MMIVMTVAMVPVNGHPLHLLLLNSSLSEGNISVTSDKVGYLPNSTGLESEIKGNLTATSSWDVNSNNTRNTSKDSPFLFRMPGCSLPTCQTANLGDSLQTGDEKAGKATIDPYGNGKK